jgi:hypothetical protein
MAVEPGFKIKGRSEMANERISAPCRCGKVEFEIVGPPILHGICYCTSCQEAGRRQDRVRCVRGGELLEERRLKPESPTRRMVARCCNTAMFLEITKGHWLTFYRGRLPDDIPPATLRLMTAKRPTGVNLPDDMPNYPGFSGKFMLKLLVAWMAMGFRRPAVEGVP